MTQDTRYKKKKKINVFKFSLRILRRTPFFARNVLASCAHTAVLGAHSVVIFQGTVSVITSAATTRNDKDPNVEKTCVSNELSDGRKWRQGVSSSPWSGGAALSEAGYNRLH